MKFNLLLPALALAVSAQPVLACATCYGASDSPMARGMNWGIFSLLAVVTCVLGSIAAFAIYLAKRSAVVANAGLSAPLPESTQED